MQKDGTRIPEKIEPDSNSVAAADDPPAPAQKPSDTPPPAPKHDRSDIQKLSPSPVKENPDNILPPEPPKPIDLPRTAPPVAPEKAVTASPATDVKEVKPAEIIKLIIFEYLAFFVFFNHDGHNLGTVFKN